MQQQVQQHIGQESCESQSRRSSNWLNMRLFVVILTAVVLLEHVSFAFGDQSAVNSLINLQKRIDYRTCIDRFDVHADTIIQTDESRAMGATFLYHVETLNRNECLEVCCQTDRCDVSIFEEKYQGSCFLFQCGPPDDFRCQFASHANYSIAVLSAQQRYKKPPAQDPPPPQPPAPQTPHVSQQVEQLLSLKDMIGRGRAPPQTAVAPIVPAVPATTTTTTTAAPAATFAPCGRFQFRCQNGECIAIYNACDGIVQCEDGSDETPSCVRDQPTPIVSNNKKHNSQMEEPPLYRINPAVQPEHNSFASRPAAMPQFPGKLYEGSEGMNLGGGGGYMSGTIEKPPPLMRNREDPVPPSGRYYNNNQAQQQQQQRNSIVPLQIQPQNQDNLNGMMYNGDPVNRFSGSNSAAAAPSSAGRPIENYYPGGYRYPSNNQQQSQSSPLQPVILNGGQPANGLRPWHPAAAGTGGYAPNPNQIYSNNLPGQQQQPLNYPLPNTNENQNGNNWPTSIGNLPPANLTPNSAVQQQQQQQQQQQSAANLPPISSNSLPQPIPPAVNPQANNQDSKAPSASKGGTEESDSSDEDSAEEPEATEAAPKKGKSRGKHRKLDKGDADETNKGMPTFPPVYQQLKAIGSELLDAEMDHDGHSDRPTGAVVSLVIGVSITAVLAIFIGCRMKTVGRRIRRTGKGPYAHDADFLVNGMYL